MGAIYKTCENRKQKGRYIYNRNRLHKVGWKPKRKFKYEQLRLEFIKLRLYLIRS